MGGAGGGHRTVVAAAARPRRTLHLLRVRGGGRGYGARHEPCRAARAASMRHGPTRCWCSKCCLRTALFEAVLPSEKSPLQRRKASTSQMRTGSGWRPRR